MEVLLCDMLLGGKAPERAERARVVFFDDSASNVAGALKAGFVACHTPHGFTRAAWASLAAQDAQVFSDADRALGRGSRMG